MPTTAELNWLAGLMEGEGHFGTSDKRSPRVTIEMTDRDVIYRARNLFGATSVYEGRCRSGKPSYRISLTGSRAVGWMMTLYSLMGERRRRRITEMLAMWRSRPALNARKTHCIRGHAFDEANTYQYTPTHRMCRACQRGRQRREVTQ